jgi:predicted amidohydrolase
VQYLSSVSDKYELADIPGPQTVRVAVLQLATPPGDVDGNVSRLVSALERHGSTADLVVAPELATPGYDLDLLQHQGTELAETVNGPTLRRLQHVCVAAATTLVTGFLERDGDALYDSVATIEPDGGLSVYRKTHLYPPEAALFAPGQHLQTVDSAAGVLGPLVCFEHAFPDVATILALGGAQILVIPSAVPIGYEYLLALRTRARARTTRCSRSPAT